MSDASRKSGRSSTSDTFAGSDFLFHLYRGTELLQDNKVHAAKSEIEDALRLQPREPQGQDLLAQVYFRLGLYPRSIAIYESLAETFPEEVTPRINLALCYLKTGQPERARFQLEQVVSTEPQRQRAWGYLGLAFERLGDYEKAHTAFERAGYKSMAGRMASLRASSDAPSPPDEPAPPEPPDLSELRSVAEAAFHELDVTDDAFSLALPAGNGSVGEQGSWFAVELGQSRSPAHRPAAPRAVTVTDREPTPAAPAASAQPVHDDAPSPTRSSWPSVKPVSEFARDATLVFCRGERASQHDSGCALVSTPQEFAVRFDLVRAVTTSGHLSAESLLSRRPSDAGASVPLGGPTRPLTLVDGAQRLVLRPDAARCIHSVELKDDSIHVREDCLAGFDARLHYETGRLASGHGDSITLVHLHGEGLVVVDLPRSHVAVEVTEAAGCVVRGASLLGWAGCVVARCLPAVDAPARERGWAAMSGTGVVFFDSEPNPGF